MLMGKDKRVSAGRIEIFILLETTGVLSSPRRCALVQPSGEASSICSL